MFELFVAIVYGIVEGVTEWLPISSTGHMILLSELLALPFSDGFFELFLVVIQLFAIMAVPTCMGRRLLPNIKDKASQKSVARLWLIIITATLPSALLGLLLDDIIEERLYTPMVVSAMLVFYGAFFILMEKRKRARVRIECRESISAFDALAVGAFQALALIPGTSRSGATILGATVLGFSKETATEFSFFMAIPTMLGASLLKLIKFYTDSGMPSREEFFLLFVGGACAYAVSCLVIKFLSSYVKKHGFFAFGVYRIILGVIVLSYFLIKG